MAVFRLKVAAKVHLDYSSHEEGNVFMEHIGIVGAGQMGSGIAQVAALSGFRVLLADASPDQAEKGKAKIGKSIERGVEKGRISSSEAQVALNNIRTGSMDGFRDVDFAIEAATENKTIKYKIFQDLDKVLPSHAVLATNTSSISITAIGAQTSRPGNVVGMHFMNPVPVMKLIEGIRGLRTSDSTVSKMRKVGEAMGKMIVESRDFPGFMVNRILMPMINEAIYALYEGVGTVENIDTAMQLGTNQPMGPLTLADFIGLDTCLSIMEVLHEGLGDTKYRPCPLLKQYVSAGCVGKKSGLGFYDYRSGQAVVADMGNL